MLGAPVLCCLGALRSGAGLVTTAVPEEFYEVIASKLTDSMTAGLTSIEGAFALSAYADVLELMEGRDVLALGCGIGRSAPTVAMVRRLLPALDKPTVIDADGLFALSEGLEILKRLSAPIVLTPHPGEMARLLGTTSGEVQSDRLSSARDLARRYPVVVVLKGHRTLVAEGERVYENTTGNPAMATGGMGDVLTGIIASLIGQGLDAYEASCLGVYIHGRAGDIGFSELGNSLIASDLLTYLSRALQEVTG